MSRTELSHEARCQLLFLKSKRINYSENEELKSRGLIHSDIGTLTDTGYDFDPYTKMEMEENKVKNKRPARVAKSITIQIKKNIIWDYLKFKNTKKVAFKNQIDESFVKKVIKDLGL